MSDMDIVIEGGPSGNLEGEENEYIEPVALLMDELKSEDTAVRVEAMRRLRTISLALGPERTRTELIPFLQTSLDEEDEVLATLAEEVANLVDSIGGTHNVYSLLPLLEGLVSAEETFVRNKALEACRAVLVAMPFAHIIEYILPLLQRLAVGDWFSKKTSVAALVGEVIERMRLEVETEAEADGDGDGDGEAHTEREGQRQRQRETEGETEANTRARTGSSDDSFQIIIDNLLTLLSTLATDESPLVRKAVAVNLVKVAASLSPEALQRVTHVCMQLASDPQDSVRLLAVEPLAVLLGQTGTKEREALIPVFLALASDNSWRIRFMVASHYNQFAQRLDKSVVSKMDILAIYCALLRDAESEVRSSACGQLAAVAAALPGDATRDQILESVRLLLADPSPHVRASLALQLSDLARVFGIDVATSSLLPMILQQLRDDSSEVRLNVISRLDVIVDVIGIEKLSTSLLPAIVNLAEDRQWRVRQTIIEYIPELSAHLGQGFFDEKLAELVIGWLGDPVYAVRHSVIDCAKRIMRQFGGDWAVSSGFLGRLLELGSHRNYLRRMTLLSALASTCSSISPAVIRDHYLPLVEKLASDPIANVRFNVAKTLEAFVPVLLASSDGGMAQSLLRTPIVPILQQLQRDSDHDVHNFATRALNLIPAF